MFDVARTYLQKCGDDEVGLNSVEAASDEHAHSLTHSLTHSLNAEK